MAKVRRVSKAVVDRLAPGTTAWDGELRGFGVRKQTRDPVYVLKYRAGGKQRQFTIGLHGAPWTPETARNEAVRLRGEIARGTDPAALRSKMKAAPTLTEFSERYLTDVSEARKKRSTARQERQILKRHILPRLGSRKVAEIDRGDVIRFHVGLKAKPSVANRAIALLSHMLNHATENGERPEIQNPCRRVKKYPEYQRDRFLSADELSRLGAAILEGETVGIPWEPRATGKTKHAPKKENRRAAIGPHAAAALRLLLFTGARHREILHLQWEHVDFDRGLLLIPDSKTGKKTIVLNAPALAVLATLPRSGAYVIAGDDPEKPRADLKRPWALVRRRAELDAVRIHDLRHTFASFGAGASLGLPIVGKLLGHANPATTARYAHLDADPVRRASDAIGSRIAAAMAGKPSAEVIPMHKPAAG